MKFYLDQASYTCGLGVIGDFGHKGGQDLEYLLEDYEQGTKYNMDGGGTGYNVAGFINEKNSEKMYSELVKNVKIVYQSPVKLNKNSGNQFFFIVFDVTGKPGKRVREWPFKEEE